MKLIMWSVVDMRYFISFCVIKQSIGVFWCFLCLSLFVIFDSMKIWQH